jgi:hypothetical protein
MMNTTLLLELSPLIKLRLILMLFLFPAEWGGALLIVELLKDVKLVLRIEKPERRRP